MTGTTQETFVKVPFSLLVRLVERLEPKEMLSLWQWLDQRLADYEDRRMLANPVIMAEIRQAHAEYRAVDYLTLDELEAKLGKPA